MPPVHTHHASSIAVSARRTLARRPWIQWIVIIGVAAAIAVSFHARLQQIDQRRDAWGATRSVLVTTGPSAPGEPIRVERTDLPVAVIPEQALEPDRILGDHVVARQHLGHGEIVTERDIAAGGAPRALIPEGWLAVPLVESPRSGATIGDRVRVASDGWILAHDALVVGGLDNVTLLAVPADEAALLPAAAAAGALTLLLIP